MCVLIGSGHARKMGVRKCEARVESYKDAEMRWKGLKLEDFEQAGREQTWNGSVPPLSTVFSGDEANARATR